MLIPTVQLSAEDEIRFFDPEKYKDTKGAFVLFICSTWYKQRCWWHSMLENPSFTFIRNPDWATTFAESINDLFLTGKKIGSGSFGQVYSAQCKKTNKIVAMKVIYKNALFHKPKARESLLREIGVCLSFPVHVSAAANRFCACCSSSLTCCVYVFCSPVSSRWIACSIWTIRCTLSWNSKSILLSCLANNNTNTASSVAWMETCLTVSHRLK